MTFSFDTFSGLLFFLSFGALFFICANSMSDANRTRQSDCPMHPFTETCAHRKEKK